MAHITSDRVKETSTSTGTGPVVVTGTSSGYVTFASVSSVSDTFYYTIAHSTLDEWEVGTGTYSSANTITRTTVLSSSNANSLVTFSAGSKTVFITAPAGRFVQADAAGNVNVTSGTVSVSGSEVHTDSNFVAGTDYQAPLVSGTNIKTVNSLSIVGSGNVAISSGYTWVSKTAAYTMVSNDGVLADTTLGTFALTLPATPAVGDKVAVADPSSSWTTNNLTINGNGSTIYNSGTPLICDISNLSITLIYDGSTWTVFAQVGGQDTAGIATAYDVAINNGFVGTEQQWLDSLQGNMQEIVLTKTAGENVQLTVNFANRLGGGETITGITSIVVNPSAVLTVSNQSFTDSAVSFYITGGAQFDGFSIVITTTTSVTTRVATVYLLNI